MMTVKCTVLHLLLLLLNNAGGHFDLDVCSEFNTFNAFDAFLRSTSDALDTLVARHSAPIHT